MQGLKEATMLYRKGTEDRIHGVHVDMITVDAHEVDDYLVQGWYRTPTEVKEALIAEEAARAAAADSAVQKAAAKAAKQGTEQKTAETAGS
ncbi:hypothetical protein [Burkholderia vietnamiensis]|uniref:hypothetical protein n=1 Tax=Burkholderia vietnamiensis TaxID=60552 RepID=UPI00352F5B14